MAKKTQIAVDDITRGLRSSYTRALIHEDEAWVPLSETVKETDIEQALDRTVRQFTNALTEKNTKIKDLGDETARLQRECERLGMELSSALKRLDNLNADIANVQNNCDVLTREKSGLAEKLEAVRAQNLALRHHARHSSDCKVVAFGIRSACTCGYSAALAGKGDMVWATN